MKFKETLLVIICRGMEAGERIQSEFLNCDERDVELNKLANQTVDDIIKAIEKHKWETAVKELFI